MDVADTAVDHVMIGDDVAVGADDVTGAGLASGALGFRVRLSVLRLRLGCNPSREIAGVVDAVGLDLADAIGKGGQQRRG